METAVSVNLAPEKSGKTSTLKDFLYLMRRPNADGSNAKVKTRTASDDNVAHPDSSEGMIKAWKNELREEKVKEMEQELEEIFAVIDKFASANADQMCAVQEAMDISMDDENFNGTFVDDCDEGCGEKSDEDCDDDSDEADDEDTGEECSEDRDYENVEVPDEALSAYIAHSDLSKEELETLYENDKGMLTWIHYQLCEEILLDND